MEKLGKNLGRYHGESIDIAWVQREAHRLAGLHGWEFDPFLETSNFTLRGYRRPFPGAARNLYLSTGIHGDEPSGPLAILQLLEENRWPPANLWLVPCLNPTGFPLNTRENSLGLDLNRDYRHLTTAEISAHVAWLQAQPRFDLTLILHEDWESNGFYVYELNPQKLPSFAEPIIEAVRELCPIESSEMVDDWPCTGGIIRPGIDPRDRPQWAEALYLIVNKSRLSYTLETPSDFDLPLRVTAHVHAVRTALSLFESRDLSEP